MCTTCTWVCAHVDLCFRQRTGLWSARVCLYVCDVSVYVCVLLHLNNTVNTGPSTIVNGNGMIVRSDLLLTVKLSTRETVSFCGSNPSRTYQAPASRFTRNMVPTSSLMHDTAAADRKRISRIQSRMRWKAVTLPNEHTSANYY